MASTDESVVLVDGPWAHRQVSANGVRFHVVELGRGPLILLLHGFPQFWWCWRRQIPSLVGAGFRVAAPDLRGYGGSDKPPRGYDAYTLSADVAGLVRALGERDAVLVGHDWGGLLAWSVATLHPQVVRRLAVVSMPHPLRLRSALVRNAGGQLRASWYVAAFQLPGIAEHLLTRNDAAFVSRLLRDWSVPGPFPDEESERRYREAMTIPAVAHCALEYYRWAVRSIVRPSGVRYARLLATRVRAPTLHLHGALDPCLLPSTAAGCGRYVDGPYDYRLLPDCGHFPAEEAPQLLAQTLAGWASGGEGTDR